jgi:hypothetical protein
MIRRRWTHVVSVGVLLAAAFSAVPVYAFGYWNVPSNFCQCAGYGLGAGYHACYVLGPSTLHDCFAHGEVRVPCAPQPAYSCGDCGYNFDFRRGAHFAPIQYHPAVEVAAPAAEQTPSLAPEHLPLPEGTAPVRPVFDPPVEP